MKVFRSLAMCFVFLVVMLAGVVSAEQGRIVIGIIPEMNLQKQLDRYAPLCKYLGRQIGMEVGVKPLANYGMIYDEMKDGKISAGFFGSFVYGMTRARLGIESIARPVTPEGVSTYKGYTIVRKDSGIKGPRDMKGKIIALVDPATTAGYLAQKDYLKRNGMDMDKDMKIFWAGSHDAAAMAVFNKQADVAGAKDSRVNKIKKENPAFAEAIAVLDESPEQPVPDNALAVIKELDPAVKEKIRKALLAMDKDTEGKAVLAKFGAARFIETKDADYKPLYDMVKNLGIDLKTYSYKKK